MYLSRINFQFITFLKSNSELHNIPLVEVNPFHTSKWCSHCGAIFKKLKLSHRSWTCEICGTTHDRDVNAAINLRNLVREVLPEPDPSGSKRLQRSNKPSLGLPSKARSVKQKSGTKAHALDRSR